MGVALKNGVVIYLVEMSVAVFMCMFMGLGFFM